MLNLFNLPNRLWGPLGPQRTKISHIFVIGWLYLLFFFQFSPTPKVFKLTLKFLVPCHAAIVIARDWGLGSDQFNKVVNFQISKHVKWQRVLIIKPDRIKECHFMKRTTARGIVTKGKNLPIVNFLQIKWKIIRYVLHIQHLFTESKVLGLSLTCYKCYLNIGTMAIESVPHHF